MGLQVTQPMLSGDLEALLWLASVIPEVTLQICYPVAGNKQQLVMGSTSTAIRVI
jgi:hypothetical protein